MQRPRETIWTPEHFIGGHPAVDFTNTVFTRYMPADDNDLLNSPRDIGNWFQVAGLATSQQAQAISGISDPAFLESIRKLRDASFSVFDALASDDRPEPAAMGLLFDRAGNGFSSHRIAPGDTSLTSEIASFDDPEAIIAFLAAISVEASIVLPRQRLCSCPRCGWLFLDTSRGGRRRWCSMETCGNREKAFRHRTRH